MWFVRHVRDPGHSVREHRRSHVLGSGNYESCLLFEDYFLWARMLMKGYHLANLPYILVETEVDLGYFSRRGGIAYVRKEIYLMQKLKKIGFLSLVGTGIFLLSRLPMRILPLKVRQYLYKVFLRHP